MATGTTREEPARAADTGTPLLALEQVTKRFGGQVAVDAGKVKLTKRDKVLLGPPLVYSAKDVDRYKF